MQIILSASACLSLKLQGNLKMNVKITKAISEEDISACMSIRRKVFIEGQNIPEEIEMDKYDAESDHYILKIDSAPVGAARVRYLGDESKIQRVAILDEYQGKGLGRKLMQYIIEDIIKKNVAKSMILSSQVHAIPFYESLGFIVSSEEYMEAGIKHKDMCKNVQN